MRHRTDRFVWWRIAIRPPPAPSQIDEVTCKVEILGLALYYRIEISEVRLIGEDFLKAGLG